MGWLILTISTWHLAGHSVLFDQYQKTVIPLERWLGVAGMPQYREAALFQLITAGPIMWQSRGFYSQQKVEAGMVLTMGCRRGLLVRFVLLLSTLVVVTESTAENIIENGSFESEALAPYWWRSIYGTSTETGRTTDYRTDGEWSRWLRSERGDRTGGSILLAQIADVPGNSRVVFSFDAIVQSRPNENDNSVTFSILGAGRGDPPLTTTGQVFLPDTDGEFRHFAFGPFTVPPYGEFPNIYFDVKVQFETIAWSDTFGECVMYLDNVIVDAVPVPEPGCCASMILGILLVSCMGRVHVARH